MTTEKIRQSLDDIDRKFFNPGPSPSDGAAHPIALQANRGTDEARKQVISLDGQWQMIEGGDALTRLVQSWVETIPVQVPGSVQTALFQSGKIPDPYVGRNDEIARAEGRKTWWLRRVFQRPDNMERVRLTFGGVCDSCTIWLNGQLLGNHKGMFAAFSFDVTDKLRDGENTLVVKLDPSLYREGVDQPNNFFKGMNVGWLDSVVINNIFGWHYINLPTIGIWRSVKLENIPEVEMKHPFVTTVHAESGRVRLAVPLHGSSADWSGILQGTIQPDNFEGTAYHFTYQVTAAAKNENVLLEFTIPDARLWYPLDYGDPNLYRMSLSFTPSQGVVDTQEFTFGVRTIEMRPLPAGPDPDNYNWTFVVNGKPMFVKGANWCTIDALLRFEPDCYDLYLSRARDAHINLLRAWGSGMPETDEFYDLTDRYGIMVMQEWPTAWNSHNIQPFDLLEDTIRDNTLRLRNRASLVMWGGGNESDKPFGTAIDVMGRLSYELDGTRPFHRGEPWGGSIHNYDVYWGRQPLRRNLSLTAPFIGEFGLPSVPNIESARRFLPEAEWNAWPPPIDGSFLHRLPVFNTKGDMAAMSRYVADWLPPSSLENFITGMQMAQTTGIRHTLELGRTRWPETTGVVYYKLNDNNPAAAWSTVDWYGVPKMAYHIARQAYRPLHACVLFDKLYVFCEEAILPVFLLDDNGALHYGGSWEVTVRAFNAELEEVTRVRFEGKGSVGTVKRLGALTLTPAQTYTAPLFITCDLKLEGGYTGRTFYWLNFEAVQGSLFDRPRTTLMMKMEDGHIVVRNTGNKPALGVHFVCPDYAHSFRPVEDFFWLDAGEERAVAVNLVDGVQITAWNV